MQIILFFFYLILVAFLECVFWGIKLFSGLGVFAVFALNKIALWKFVILFAVVSVVMDSLLHMMVGTYFSALVISLIFYYLSQLIIPSHEKPVEIIIITLTSVVFHIVLRFMFNMNNDMFTLSLKDLLFGLKSGVLSMSAYFIVYMLENLLWDNSKNKLILRN